MHLFATGLLSFLVAGAAPTPQATNDLKLISARYIEAQEAVYERGADSAKLDALMSFYSPKFVYHHPQFGAKVVGLDEVRRGVMSRLGELASAEITIKGMLVNGDMVSLALQENFTDGAGKRLDRPRITVLTFEGEKIVQRVDM